jgi:hypothetical protein
LNQNNEKKTSKNEKKSKDQVKVKVMTLTWLGDLPRKSARGEGVTLVLISATLLDVNKKKY